MQRRLITLTAVTGMALALSACGGSNQPAPAPGGHDALVQASYRYADCMRQHGLANYPDPTVSTSDGGSQVEIQAVGPDTGPGFDTARNACAKFLPGLGAKGGEVQTAAQQAVQRTGELAFTRCMRSHGFPTFPDPNAQGHLTPEMVSAAGINLHQPAVLQAGDACAGSSHGFITRADVARAVSGTQNGG